MQVTQWAERMLQKASAIAIKGSLRVMLDAWVDWMGDDMNCEKEEAKECLSTLGNVISSQTITTDLTRQLFPSQESPLVTDATQMLITSEIPVDLTDDIEED